MNVKVYQIDPANDPFGIIFETYPKAISKVHRIDERMYKTVFDGPVEDDDLEVLYEQFNTAKPPAYNGHSLAISDIIETENGCFYCDIIGFRELPDFDGSKVAPKQGNRMVVIEPHKPAYEAIIEDSLEALQNAVGGYIEVTYPFDDNAFIVGNDEAKLEGLDGNRRIGGGIYAGNLLIGADDGAGGTKDLTDEQVNYYLDMFSQPEEISKEEVEADTGWKFIELD